MRILGIVMGFLSIASFIVYYECAFYNYPNIPEIYYNTANWMIWTTLSISFFLLGRNETNKKLKYLIYYNIAFFWLYLVLAYLINEYMDFSITMHKVVISLVLTSITCLICYFVPFPKFLR